MTHNVTWLIWSYLDCIVYCWQRAHASFNVTCFHPFVGASDIMSSVDIMFNFFTVTQFQLSQQHLFDRLILTTACLIDHCVECKNLWCANEETLAVLGHYFQKHWFHPTLWSYVTVKEWKLKAQNYWENIFILWTFDFVHFVCRTINEN